ncbi:unnamed protein product [Allacma fusca]|uniref:Uncharacterized protein n=1 Tax=Allacma fusca TaxID=39272 RepID=A0A8J2LF05_9HEXA|nr:unnamed protein product [Allacma fusca]
MQIVLDWKRRRLHKSWLDKWDFKAVWKINPLTFWSEKSSHAFQVLLILHPRGQNCWINICSYKILKIIGTGKSYPNGKGGKKNTNYATFQL